MSALLCHAFSAAHADDGISFDSIVWKPLRKLGICSRSLFTARKRSLRRLCFYTCQSVILFTGWVLHPVGVCIQGGLHLGESAPWGSASRGCYIQEGVCIWGLGRPPVWYYRIRSMSGRYASYWNAFLLLPPTNKVWGKVIFLHLFVVALGGVRGCSRGVHAWLLCRGIHGCSWGGMRGCSGGHVWLFRRACMVAPGGACVVAWGACMVAWGHAWLLWGGMSGCSGGHVWLFLGGMHGCSGGHEWLLRGACVVALGGHVWLLGGVCMVAPRGCAWDTMRYNQWAGSTHPTGMHSC